MAPLKIETPNYPIFIGKITEALNSWLKEQFKDYTPYLLVDSNTHINCLPILDYEEVSFLAEAEVLEVEPGESAKSIEVVSQLWETLLALGATRKSVLINLGGGTITDLGGFVASTYKRGIPFVNLPTTLLAMVDASVGGKTGINLASSKNQVGVFAEPMAVFAHLPFLDSLPEREIKSGSAEMLKHGLIASAHHWHALVNPSNTVELDSISESIRIKEAIVTSDYKEQRIRKKLNFGHTVGHALESYSHVKNNPLLHGEAVAFGMLVETELSNQFEGLHQTELEEIRSLITTRFGKFKLETTDIPVLLDFMQLDKKNNSEQINFTLLRSIGKAVVDVNLSKEEVENTLLKFVNP